MSGIQKSSAELHIQRPLHTPTLNEESHPHCRLYCPLWHLPPPAIKHHSNLELGKKFCFVLMQYLIL